MGPSAEFTDAIPESVPEKVRFGVFEADLRSGELRREGIKVRLQDLPFRALTYFVTHPETVISREEFRQALWPADVFVDFDQGISSAIRRLREALGDSADNPIFIQTIERRGYRWIAPLHFPKTESARAAPQVVIEAPPAEHLPEKIFAAHFRLCRGHPGDVDFRDLAPPSFRSRFSGRGQIHFAHESRAASGAQSRGGRPLLERPCVLEQAHA